MGRPMPGWEVAILDEDERPVAQGERGEICLRARSNPHYPLGYWNRPPQDTEETFGGDWFHTKDAASDRRGRLLLVRGPRRRRDHLGRVPDRALRGRVGLPGASRRRRGGRGGGRRRAPRQRRQGVRRARRRPRAERRARRGDQGVRARAPVGLCLPPAGRVRARPAQDADRQDPADRAAPARGGPERRLERRSASRQQPGPGCASRTGSAPAAARSRCRRGASRRRPPGARRRSARASRGPPRDRRGGPRGRSAARSAASPRGR